MVGNVGGDGRLGAFVAAAVFDMDGVLTDTTELHYLSWIPVAEKLSIPFDRRRYDSFRGLSRPECLSLLLGERETRYSSVELHEFAEEKNTEYLRLVADMTPANLFVGVLELIEGLRERGAGVAVASSSRNTEIVAKRLGILPLLDVLVDANTATRSKPDPEVFLLAAERMGLSPARCVVLEDAEAGVQAALAGGFRVIGIGPAERVGRAHMVVDTIGELTAGTVLGLLAK